MTIDRMKDYKSKSVGEVTNGQKIEAFGLEFEINGIWNNPKLNLEDPETGHQWIEPNIPCAVLEGEVYNGTMYGAKIYVHKDLLLNRLWQHIGKQIKQKRTGQHLTQAQLGARVDANRSYIARLEGGKRPCSLNKLGEIADALNCELNIELS